MEKDIEGVFGLFIYFINFSYKYSIDSIYQA